MRRWKRGKRESGRLVGGEEYYRSTLIPRTPMPGTRLESRNPTGRGLPTAAGSGKRAEALPSSLHPGPRVAVHSVPRLLCHTFQLQHRDCGLSHKRAIRVQRASRGCRAGGSSPAFPAPAADQRHDPADGASCPSAAAIAGTGDTCREHNGGCRRHFCDDSADTSPCTTCLHCLHSPRRRHSGRSGGKIRDFSIVYTVEQP